MGLLSSGSRSSPPGDIRVPVHKGLSIRMGSLSPPPSRPMGEEYNVAVRPPSKSDKHIISLPIIAWIGITAGIVFLIAMLVLSLLCAKKRKMEKQTRDFIEERKGDVEYETTVMLENGSTSARFSDLIFDFNKNTYTYEELKVATDQFSQANLLGEGGFGKVYKGLLSNNTEIAVKVLKPGSSQGDKQFRAELKTISRLHHRHLVSIIGYCVAGVQRLLVYPYIPNKTLEHHLYATDATRLDWTTRLNIAIGIAKGLAYLHEDCQPRIIHRDIKTANILLDNNFETKIADFGLSKLLGEEVITQYTSQILGTCGYLAPEYERNGRITEKVDIFAFGVLLLELITGRRPTSDNSEETLAEWARPILNEALDDGNFNRLLDRRTSKNYDPLKMTTMIGCAAAALQKPANLRPKMSQIVRALEGSISLHEMNGTVLTDHITRVDSIN